MTAAHAVIWIDHEHARILTLDSEGFQSRQVKAHHHATKQHGSEVRTAHEFFGEACDALDGVAQVLVTGSHQALADLRHYVDKHRPPLAPRIVGWEVSDHPSDPQLAALARSFFLRHDRMTGTAPLP